MTRPIRTIVLDGEEFVLLPRAEYLALKGVPANSVQATGYVATHLGRDLKAARLHARLTQVELANRLGKSQSLVASTEKGTTRAGVRYVKAVLAACGLPEDWNPNAPAKVQSKAAAKKRGVRRQA